MRSVLLVLALVSAFPHWSSAQDSGVSQARSLLREASGLIKENPDSQQESAAANVASQLARSGDLVDALNTAHLLKPELQGLAISCVAWQLAHGGNADLALSLIGSMKAGDGRDMAYAQVSQALGQKGDMDQAMIAVHRIADPSRWPRHWFKLLFWKPRPGALRKPAQLWTRRSSRLTSTQTAA